MSSKSIRVMLISCSLLIFSGCASDAYLPANSELLDKTTPGVAKEYRIGIDDTIQINVWKNPELTLAVPVRPDGKISMPLIGDVMVAGLAPEQVAADIQQRLAEYIRSPNVSIIVTDLKSHEYLTRVRVTGAVETVTSINYRQGMTVLDAVLAAGGVNKFSAPNGTKLYRKVDGKPRVINIHLDEILNNGSLSTNINLSPGDIITVPERLF